MTVPETDFLASPEAVLAHGTEVPPAWVARAWREHPTFRSDVTYYLARSVSKVGSFNLAGEVWLRILPEALSGEEAAALYSDIATESQRLEFEWRSEFVAAFPSSEALLPEPRDHEILRETVEDQIVTGNGMGFEMTVQTLASLPGGMRTLQEPNAQGATLLEMAERMGRTVMAEILREPLARSGAV